MWCVLHKFSLRSHLVCSREFYMNKQPDTPTVTWSSRNPLVSPGSVPCISVYSVHAASRHVVYNRTKWNMV
jgi:hypothetical protein